ncbi:MAG: hypothetical protein ACR2NA_02015 [Solirubrobacterales bacterium]
MSPLFFVIFGPLTLASFLLCGEDSSFRGRVSSPANDLSGAGRREFARFIRSSETVPDQRVAQAVFTWAETTLRRERCRWERYLNGAWVLWIGSGLVAAIAFGTVRDVAIHLVVFDVMLLVAYMARFSRRRARMVLAAAGRPV